MLHRTLVMIAALTLSALSARAAHAQSRGDAGRSDDPWFPVRGALGDGPLVAHQTARHAGGARDWTVAVPTHPNQCYRVVGRALGASRVTGRVVIRGAAADRDELVLSTSGEPASRTVCPTGPVHGFSVVVHTEGPTRWALGVMVGQGSADDAHGPPSDVPPPSPDHRPVVDAGVARPAANYPLGGAEADYVGNQLRGFARDHGETRAVVAAARAMLPTNQTRELSLPLEAGHCIDAVAAGVPSVHDLDLELADPAGNRVVQDTGHNALESVHYCPTYTGSYRLTVRMFAGSGQTGIQAFESAR